jgi:O-antigen biosynthesis protein
LPASERPRASILIAADRDADLLARCLDSIGRNTGAEVPFEIIVVLNGSPDAVVRFVRDVAGIKVVESSVNRGVAGGYNLGRRSATGEFLVLLHDDTEVLPGWLEALARAADEVREAGAIGSRLLNPDGTIQAAGSVLWRDGRVSAVGLNEAGDGPAFQERRIVDTCGTASMLVRAATWDAVGGLEERLFPAYYVDVDLCMKVRRQGEVALYEPGSRVIHRRSGLSVARDFRHFVVERNRPRFLEKWRADLPGYFSRKEQTLEEAVERAARQSAARRSTQPVWPGSDGPPGAALSEADFVAADLALKEDYIAELERVLESLRKALATIESTRTWRLRRRFLPFIRLVRRIARM